MKLNLFKQSVCGLQKVLLITLFLFIFFNQGSLAQSLRTFDFQKAYAVGVLMNLPDSIIIVADSSQIDEKTSYTTLNKVRHNLFRLNFGLMQNGFIVNQATYKCKLKIKLDEVVVQLKLCGREKKYLVANFRGNENKLLLREIIYLPDVQMR